MPQGGKVSIPNDTTNGGRALFLLEAAGLIKLKDDVGVSPTKADIVENTKNITIDELDAAQVARTLPDVDAAVINTNLAIDAGLSPKDDAIFMEPVNENSAPTLTTWWLEPKTKTTNSIRKSLPTTARRKSRN